MIKITMLFFSPLLEIPGIGRTKTWVLSESFIIGIVIALYGTRKP